MEVDEIWESEKHYGYADAVNRRARAAVVVLLLAAGAFALTAGGDEPERPPPEVLGTQLIAGGTGVSGFLVVGDDGRTAPAGAPPTTEASTLAQFSDPAWEPRAGETTATSTSVASDQTVTTSAVPPTTTSTTATTVTTTTTTTTTVTPTTTSTTTTTVPPTTTTTVPPTTTTTVPPTTTTVPTSDAWFAILDASLSCVEDAPVITWYVYDPSEPWSNGWQIIIDGASRGLFTAGTVITANGGPGVAEESVTVGSHTLVVDRHWETISGGNDSRGYGSDSLTVVVEESACG